MGDRREGTHFEELNPARYRAVNAVTERLTRAYPASAKVDLAAMRDAIENYDRRDPEAVKRDLHLFAHNFSGQGGMFGYPLVSKIAASMSAYLGAHERYADLKRQTIEDYFDAIEETFDRKLTGEVGVAGAAILARLEAP